MGNGTKTWIFDFCDGRRAKESVSLGAKEALYKQVLVPGTTSTRYQVPVTWFLDCLYCTVPIILLVVSRLPVPGTQINDERM